MRWLFAPSIQSESGKSETNYGNFAPNEEHPLGTESKWVGGVW